MSDLEGLWGDSTQEAMAEEARGSFTVLPPGWYTVTILKAELADTKNGGKMVVADMETKSSDSLVARFNIKNNSAKAETIGRQQLAKCATVAGVKNLTDSNQLHGMALDVKVTVEEFKSNTTGDMLKSNNIGDFAKAGTKATGQPAQDSGNGAAAPW